MERIESLLALLLREFAALGAELNIASPTPGGFDRSRAIEELTASLEARKTGAWIDDPRTDEETEKEVLDS